MPEKIPAPSVPASQVAPPPAAPPDQPVAPSVPPVLSPDEQMALFEKELKENDWGHQPC